MNARRGTDDGLTLVEMIVTVALTSVVLMFIGGLFISTFLAERIVSSSSVAASEAQVTVRSIGERVSSSSGLQLTAPTAGDQLLVVRSAGRDATITWVCNAWYYSGAEGVLYSTQTPAGTIIDAPSSTELGDWAVALSGVTPTDPAGIFGGAGDEVTIAFRIATDGAPPVDISTAVTRPDVASGEIPGGSACF